MIAAASATAMTTAVGAMETHLAAFAQDVAAYRAAYGNEHRLAYQRGGLNGTQELDAVLGLRMLDALLVVRLRGLNCEGLLLASTASGARDEHWADDLIPRLHASAAQAAA